MSGIRSDILLRARFIFLLALAGALAILAKAIYIQFYKGKAYREIARQNSLKYRTVKATRGNIYSDNGSLLATSLPRYRLAFDPCVANEQLFRSGIDSLSYFLSDYYGDKSPEEYKAKLVAARKKNNRYLVLSRDLVGYQTKKKMKQWPIFRERRNVGGAIFEKVNERYRPFNALALRTIGRVSDNNYGVSGLEFSFNKYLAGVQGEALYRKMPGGQWRPIYDGNEVSPVDGLDVHTTLDINLQDVAENSLLDACVSNDAEYGCVLVMETATGEIKAMVNLSKLRDSLYGEVYNYAVDSKGRVNPGSTFKLASYMALFEDHKIKISDSVYTGDGVYRFYDDELHDPVPAPQGMLSVRQAFEKSSNVISKLVYKHYKDNPQRFLDYLDKFGLSQPLDFQLEGTAKPYIKTTKDPTWSGITLPWMAVGYELELTPLQLTTFYNAVANKGKVMKPYIVKEVRRAGEVEQRYQPEVLNDKICSDKTLYTLQRLLEGVVERGTARNIRNSEYKIAGKTGTSQKIKNGKYTRSYYTSFVGYFPADKPKYTCMVVIDDPKGSSVHGSDVAAPVFKDIADKVFSTDVELHRAMKVKDNREPGYYPVVRAGYYPDLKYLCNSLGISNHSAKAGTGEWVEASTKKDVNAIFWRAQNEKYNRIPDVRGMMLRDALYLLENRGLEVEVVGRGRVFKQSILPGSKAEHFDHVKIWLDS